MFRIICILVIDNAMKEQADKIIRPKHFGVIYALILAAMVLIPSESTARAMFDAYWIETIVITTKDAQNRDVEELLNTADKLDKIIEKAMKTRHTLRLEIYKRSPKEVLEQNGTVN